jgi:S-phase kinase-associated protein 1
MASIAADNKGKRPMYPEDDLTEVKPSLPSDPEAGSAGEKKPEGEGAEGGGDDLLLVTECGTELRFSRLAARMSTMLYGMMEVGCAVGRIRVPDIDAGTLRLVAAYCEKHGPYYDPATACRDRDTFLPLPIDFMPAAHAIKPVTEPDPDPHGLNSWDQEFITVGIDITTLCSILLVSNRFSLINALTFLPRKNFGS